MSAAGCSSDPGARRPLPLPRLPAFSLLVVALAAVAGCEMFAPDFGEIRQPRIRPLRDRAAQHDAVLRLRTERILPEVMARHGVDCWVVLGDVVAVDPLFPLLTTSATRLRGPAVLGLCRDGAGGVDALLLGGVAAAGAYYETVRPATGREELADALRDELERREAAVVAVDRAPGTPFADGLTASGSEWLRGALAPTAARPVSAGPLARDYLGRHLEVEMPLFREAADLTAELLESVLTAEVVRPGRSSLADLAWAVRQRALEWGLEVAGEPRVRLFRPAGSPDPRDPRYPETWFLPGDLVQLTAGIRYLDYVTRTARWAYVTDTGEYRAPAAVEDAMRDLGAALEAGAADVRPEDRGGGPAVGDLSLVPLGFFGPEAAGATAGRQRAVDPRGFVGVVVRATVRPEGWREPLELELVEPAVLGADGLQLAAPLQRAPTVIE